MQPYVYHFQTAPAAAPVATSSVTPVAGTSTMPVAAAATSANLLQNLQSPLPQKTATGLMQPTAAAANAPPVILQPQQQTSQLQPQPALVHAQPQPQASNSVQQLLQVPLTSGGQQQQQPPQFTSQISRETADADAQISKLLETFQKDPGSLSIENDKMADLIR